ncbi:unnamed protein product [Leptidea sinapis]|uniref:Uncharacterized protein n=1 Tax=Leptidea sinapis TaxID=189913 RepID=A0A5E4R6T0_9NEOP|nr:unnamed protein product [Leptidea sinapis]
MKQFSMTESWNDKLEVIEERKLLLLKMLEAREAGKFAIIKYNKLIVKNNVDNRQQNRKRQPSSLLRTPPNNNLNINKNITLISQTAKQLKANRFDVIPSTSTTRIELSDVTGVIP